MLCSAHIHCREHFQKWVNLAFVLAFVVKLGVELRVGRVIAHLRQLRVHNRAVVEYEAIAAVVGTTGLLKIFQNTAF